MKDYTFIVEKEHQNAFDISNIKDPIIREICFLGFVIIHTDIVSNKLRLYKEDRTEYQIDLFDFQQICVGLKIIRGILYSGERYAWISDANGDGDKFRNFILENTGAVASN